MERARQRLSEGSGMETSSAQQSTTQLTLSDRQQAARKRLLDTPDINFNEATQGTTEVTDTDRVATTEIDESPEAYFLRTGEVPEGYKYELSVPTGNKPEDRVKLVPINAPIVEEQIDETFDYDRTAKLTSQIYPEQGPALDVLGVHDFADKDVPAVLQPLTRLVGRGLNKIIRPLAIAIEATAETTEDFGEEFTRTVHETFTEDNKVFGLTGKEILPFSPKTAGRKFGKDMGAMLEMAEAVPATGSTFGLAGRFVTKPLRNIKKAVREYEAGEKLIADRAARKMNINQAKATTAEEISKKADAATKVAEENNDVAQELIVQFEQRTGKTISSTMPDGKLVLDGEKARKAGVETTEEIAEANKGTVREFLRGESSQSDAAVLAGMGDTITQPLLKPEKFDALVATIADLKKEVPEAFKVKYYKNADGSQGKKYNVIDHLFELTVDETLIKGDEIIDVLNRYNISFEDYILTVVGSGSEAGKTLQKLSQIKRMRPANEMIAMQEAATKEAAGAIRNTVMRIENIRRGGLVSQVATAARNLQSGGIRAPLEGLGNVMDTALYNMSEEGAVAGIKSLGSFNNWKDSFRHMKYMFGPETRLDVEDYTDFILGQPELEKQFDLMFNNLNEIQKATGRGDGGVLDNVLSEAEDAIDFLNTPNRWQEFLIRRGAFLGELERLTKREYGIDLIDALNDGKIRDLLNDASTVKPKGAKSFNLLVADATDRALDMTYAKQPEIPVFRSTASFITRNGLTVVLPFPRFMFNSMELMGQYAGGASIPLAKKVASIVTRGKVGGKGKLSAKDRQRISRNIVGITAGAPIAPVAIGAFLEDPSEEGDGTLDTIVDYAGSMLQSMSAVGAFYQYRTSENAPADYKLMNTGNNTVLDTTPQYPLRQFAYLGEATKRLVDGTFDDWFDGKEFAETFIGTNIRQGVGNSLIEEVINSTMSNDLTSKEAWGRSAGRALGNYLATWAVPLSQIIEAERATGQRGVDYKDTGTDPTLDFQTSFMQNLSRPFKRFISAGEEEALPNREFLFTEKKSRVMPVLRVLGGLNITTADEPYGEYITSLGFTDYGLGSKSKVNSVRRFEDKVVREALPFIVEEAQSYEEDLRERYRNSSTKVKEEFTEDKFVSSRLRKFIKDQIKDVRSEVSDGSVLTADAPEYSQAMLTYRRLSPDTREAAGVQFIEEYDRKPDPLKPEDLNSLVILGQAYDEAFK